MSSAPRTAPWPGERDVHLWLAAADTPQALTSTRQALAEGWLNAHERERWQRFYFARDRDRFLVARALVRSTLSWYLPDIAQEHWRFEDNAYGRPSLVAEQQLGPSPLYFNLSHTRGLVALAVAGSAQVGVDVEPTDRDGPYLSMADHFFAPPEAAALRALAGGEGVHQQRFLELWTLKESYIKARGMGLSLPLDSFAFHFDHPSVVGFQTWPAAGDTAEGWTFASGRVAGSHRLALALREGAEDAPLNLQAVQVGAAGEWQPPVLTVERRSCSEVRLQALTQEGGEG